MSEEAPKPAKAKKPKAPAAEGAAPERLSLIHI